MSGDAATTNGKAAPGTPAGATPGKNSIERIYQKKTQLEHILLRPDTYIGSVEPITQPMWVYDGEDVGMVFRPITYTPGLYKIFDEILVNASDNKQRDQNMKRIKITIDPENNKLSVWNDGKGIPVQMHKTEKMYVPSLIFGHLLTSSNFDDEEKKVVGGRNGFGAKLCNVFSTKFTVETASKANKKRFKQTWTNNMSKTKDASINDFSDNDYTCVTFEPDLEKFKMEKLDADIVSLFTKRAYDMCATANGVSIYLNGKKLPVNGFKDYVELFVKKPQDGETTSAPIVYERVSPRWEVAVANSEKGFQQISFVNSIATTKGGTHVNSVVDQLVEKLLVQVNRKNKDKIPVKPFQIKNQMWVFVNALIENPTFDSQTKENMTLQQKKFGSKCSLSEKFLKGASNCGIVDNVLQWLTFKAQKDLNKKGGSDKKQQKLKGIPKLDDANEAGGKLSAECTLILTEGDSAKSLAVSGLGVIGRDRYGVFPLRGKLLNVRDCTTKQVLDNKEISALMKIIGLNTKNKYDEVDERKILRYGKIMIMTDQDQDGSHIKGLLVNLIHHFWPSLIRRNFLDQFITPIVKASKGTQSISFFSLPEFEEWKAATQNWKTYKVKYYKGLGTSTMKEAKEYFSDMERHRIHFKYDGQNCDQAIQLGFSKAKINERKDWLLNFMADRKERRENGDADVYLYRKDTKQVSYNEFIHKELVLFSNADTERSIPSLMDGLKPGQRKVIYTCVKRNDKREVKVAQLAGSVAEQSSYHHGEASLMSTIINLAQNFVGSNNLNLLLPIGQFGTRLQGGKDAASPRYIFTMLNPATKIIFNPADEAMLTPQFDDNQKIEPEYYCPVLPMVLINGADGIGTGWSTKILNHDVREVIANVRRMLNNEEPLPMMPSYKNYKGAIRELDSNHYVMFGNIAMLDTTSVEITELPVGTWTQTYKENVLESMVNGSEKEKPVITDYKEYHTDVTVKFVVTLTEEKLIEAESIGLHKFFKLTADRASSNMVLFDSNNCIRKYDSTLEILKEFFTKRLDVYGKRKKYMIGLLTVECEKLSAIARFILEKIEGSMVVENKPKKKLILELIQKKYPSDPVKKWKEDQAKQLKMLRGDLEIDDDDDEDANESNHTDDSGADFNYILNLPMWYLTKEKKDELIKQKDDKVSELKTLQKTSEKQLWSADIDAVLKEVENQERLEQEDDVATIALSSKAAKKRAQLSGKGTGRAKKEGGSHADTKPTEGAQLVEPPSSDVLKIGKALFKPKKEKIEKIKEEERGSDDDLIEKSLADRLNDSGVDASKLASLSPGFKEKKPVVKSADGQKKGRTASSATGVKKPAAPKSSDGPKKGRGRPSLESDSKKKKKNPWETDSDESSEASVVSSEEDEEDGSASDHQSGEESSTVKVKAKSVLMKKIVDSDDPEESEEERPAPSKERTFVKQSAFPDSDSSDGESAKKTKIEPKKPAVTKKPVASKKKAFSDSEDEEKIAPKKTLSKTKTVAKPAPKSKPAAKSKIRIDDSDASMSGSGSDDFRPPTKKGKRAATNSCEDDGITSSKSRPGRERKKVKYNVDESDKDSESDSD